MLMNILLWALSTSVAFAAGLFGQIQGVPQEARDAAKSGVVSPIVNGLNFQSRIDVRLVELGDAAHIQRLVLPVDREFAFQAPELAAGEYELTVHAYDFQVRVPRYRVLVEDGGVDVFEDRLAETSYNLTSKQSVSREAPLVVQITGFKSYYESSENKLTEMIMSSPLGFIFRSTLYSSLFFGTLVILAFPYVIPYVAPEFAEQYQKMQAEMYEQPSKDAVLEDVSPEKAAVRKTRARQRK